MFDNGTFLGRRGFVRGGLALGAAAFLTPGVFADELMRTPRMTEGPFYPDKLPLDTDNDLIIIKDSITPAVGEITHLTGKIVNAGGSPVKDATIEIWQCDANAVYLNSRDRPREPRRAASRRRRGRGRHSLVRL